MGILSGIASLFGVASSASQSRRDRVFTREENQKNRDFSERMWNLQNEYNAPSAQIGRLIDAGLNPALAYGSISDGMASPASSPSTSSNPNPSQVPSSFAAAAQQFAQVEVLKSQAEKNYADADAARQNAGGQSRQNSLFDATYNERVAKIGLDNEKISADIDYTQKLIYGQGLKNSFDERTMPTRIALNDRELEKLDETINNLMADTSYKAELARYVGYNSVTGRINADAAKLNAQSYSRLVPALASQAYAIAYKNHSEGDFIASKANYALAFAKAYDLYASGDLNYETAEKVFIETLNLREYGTDRPGDGELARNVNAFASVLGEVFGLASGNEPDRPAFGVGTYEGSERGSERRAPYHHGYYYNPESGRRPYNPKPTRKRSAPRNTSKGSDATSRTAKRTPKLLKTRYYKP